MLVLGIMHLLPAVGVVDDAGVVVWLLTSILTECGRFLTWEKVQRPAPGRNAFVTWHVEDRGPNDHIWQPSPEQPRRLTAPDDARRDQ
jgi:hypothetical protein